MFQKPQQYKKKKKKKNFLSVLGQGISVAIICRAGHNDNLKLFTGFIHFILLSRLQILQS